jgi:hypothetical protein
MNMFDSLVVSDVVVTEFSDTGSMCLFNSTHLRSQIVNNICFQGPLCVTLLVNLFAYVRGVHGLKDAPQSVFTLLNVTILSLWLLLYWYYKFAGHFTGDASSRRVYIHTTM